MCDTCADWIDSVASEIEAHFLAHPKAADTAEGIAVWWIGGQRYLEAEETVQAALDRLVERGRLERLTGPGGAVVYRAAREAGDG
jgi:hypothetical protein